MDIVGFDNGKQRKDTNRGKTSGCLSAEWKKKSANGYDFVNLECSVDCNVDICYSGANPFS